MPGQTVQPAWHSSLLIALPLARGGHLQPLCGSCALLHPHWEEEGGQGWAAHAAAAFHCCCQHVSHGRISRRDQPLSESPGWVEWDFFFHILFLSQLPTLYRTHHAFASLCL